MYLREARRKNKDGTVVSYLQLAHNERHPQTGTPTAKAIHNFGRADRVDREALRRLVASVSRFLEPAQAVAAAAGRDVEIIGSRRFGGAFVLDQLWERLGIGPALNLSIRSLPRTGSGAGVASSAGTALSPSRRSAAGGNLRIGAVCPAAGSTGPDCLIRSGDAMCQRPSSARASPRSTEATDRPSCDSPPRTVR